jgi:hypothetical protein
MQKFRILQQVRTMRAGRELAVLNIFDLWVSGRTTPALPALPVLTVHAPSIFARNPRTQALTQIFPTNFGHIFFARRNFG